MSIAMRWIAAVLVISATGFATGCASKDGEVTVRSTDYSTSGNFLSANIGDSTSAVTTAVSDFKVCVYRIRLEGTNAEKQEEFEFQPGLIDLTSGNEKDWGTTEVPTDFAVARVKVKVHKDRELCGVDYSVKFNTASTPQDLEFRFRFDPPVQFSTGDVLKLNMAAIVANLRAAVDAGTINSLKERIEEVEATAGK